MFLHVFCFYMFCMFLASFRHHSGRQTHFPWAVFHEESRGTLKSSDLWARMVAF